MGYKHVEPDWGKVALAHGACEQENDGFGFVLLVFGSLCKWFGWALGYTPLSPDPSFLQSPGAFWFGTGVLGAWAGPRAARGRTRDGFEGFEGFERFEKSCRARGGVRVAKPFRGPPYNPTPVRPGRSAAPSLRARGVEDHGAPRGSRRGFLVLLVGSGLLGQKPFMDAHGGALVFPCAAPYPSHTLRFSPYTCCSPVGSPQ